MVPAGHLVVDAVSWRAIFLINLPIGAFVVLMANRHVPETRDPTTTGRLDVPGALLAAGLTGTMGQQARGAPNRRTRRSHRPALETGSRPRSLSAVTSSASSHSPSTSVGVASIRTGAPPVLTRSGGVARARLRVPGGLLPEHRQGHRPDAQAVMHLHTPHGQAVSAHSEGLLPLTQTAMLVRADLAFHDVAVTCCVVASARASSRCLCAGLRAGLLRVHRLADGARLCRVLRAGRGGGPPRRAHRAGATDFDSGVLRHGGNRRRGAGRGR